jgi:hypothetical protein
VTKAASDLAAKGYVLRADIPRIVEQAATRWDYAAKAAAPRTSQQPR